MRTNVTSIPFKVLLLLLSLFASATAYAQTDEPKEAIQNYLSQYHVHNYRPHDAMRLDSLLTDEERKEITVYPNEAFCSQPFTPQSVNRIYAEIRKHLPSPYDAYHLAILNKKQQRIEYLIPNYRREKDIDASRLWGKTDYSGHPWVVNRSLPYSIARGLQGRHLFIWPSHGRYFKNGGWVWQRPYLFCTTEDLFTQSFVFPFLFPMLENAGAVVCSPRERDYQTQMAVVDNDLPNRQGSYTETEQTNTIWCSSNDSLGFAPTSGMLVDSVQPFRSGTYRMANTVMGKSSTASATWTPRIPRTGRYAVYVSYATQPNSVPDAHYTIYHKGGQTAFEVNQQMGGGTWVYLGTFYFDEGANTQGRVVLSNQSRSVGVVTADAVRFGGGVGQHAREEAGASGLPRYLEAARYYAHWAGMPDTLVNTEQGADDYKDDLRVRSHMLNYLGGGSVYQPDTTGCRVPFELSLALHSDAGVARDNDIYGTLAISTTQDGEGNTLYRSGVSRAASSDLGMLLLETVTRDLSSSFRTSWTQREHWDRNYAETRMPNVPSVILEMLSHQNFQDMKYGHDPLFKFTLARAVYKSVLRFVRYQHGLTTYTVQPLPPQRFSAVFNAETTQAKLSWRPTIDSLETSAVPTAYVLYTKVDDAAFDNGQNIGAANEYTVDLEPGRVYAFRVTAVNAGGESFPSETLSVCRSANKNAPRVLIVNGFERLSGPATIETADSVGFDLDSDIGVPYLSTTAFSGKQQNFNRADAGREGRNGLGYSGHEWIGRELAGNTFDYPLAHGQSIAAAGYSYCSTSRSAFEQSDFSVKNFDVVDYIAGLQADKPYNLRSYRVFSSATRKKLTRYLEQQGGALLVSGSYIGSDCTDNETRAFAEDVLKYRYDCTVKHDSTHNVRGLNLEFPIYREPSAAHYAAQTPDALLPTSRQAFSAFAYENGLSAGVAYGGRKYRVVAMGFPFECIVERTVRDKAMKAILEYLKH